MEKEQEKSKGRNPHNIDPKFVIASFKDKERLNNPSSEPRPLLPENEKEEDFSDKMEKPQEISVSEEPKRKRAKSPDYENLFLNHTDISTRNGKLVSIRKKYHDKIAHIVHLTGKNEVSIFSYIDNVLSHHFDAFQDEIKELIDKKYQDIINQ